MEERLDGWAEKLLVRSSFPAPSLTTNLSQPFVIQFKASSLHLPSLTLPIRPIFLHRPSTSSPSPPPSLPWSTELGFFPVVCLSASQYIEEGADRRRPTHGGWEYVQGAGDDHELWTVGGWGSEQFWGWKDELFGGRSKGGEEGEEDGEEPEGLERRVERLVKEWKEGKSKTKTEEGGKDVDAFIYPIPTVVRPTSLLHLSILPQPPNSDVPTVTLHRHSSPLPSPSNPLHLPLAYNPAKGGITPCIAPTLTFLSPHLDQDEPKPFVIAGDDNAKDESVGIALVVLQRFFDEEGRELKEGEAGVKGTLLPSF
jgi:tRNA A64-2'-O-ribosylphosphate transferase